MLLSCADRLKNERKRIKLTQQNLALKIDVSDMTVKRWESGTSIPSDKLELLAKFGFDVLFIITGEHSQASLSSDEALLLDKYRQADAATKNKLLMLLLGVESPATDSVVKQAHTGSGNNINTHNMDQTINSGHSETNTAEQVNIRSKGKGAQAAFKISNK